MKNQPTIMSIYTHPNMKLLSLFLLIFIILTATGAPYTPTDQINLNCGSPKDVDFKSQRWTSDINSKLSPTELGGASKVKDAPPSSNEAGEELYRTARLSLSEFTYRIPVSPGQKFIRLYFFPASYGVGFESEKTLFSVKLDGFYNFTLLKDFNASVQARADYFEVLIREFMVNIEAEKQTLNITFTASKDGYAFVNGLQVMSMPDYLYYTKPSASQDETPKMVTGNMYPVDTNQAMVRMYRINVGGGLLGPDKDTGMYRTWEATDEQYLDGKSSDFSYVPTINDVDIHLSKNFANYTAPENVYKTARTMGRNGTLNKSYNLTWNFPVHPQFNYLVRLHFCEIETYIMTEGDRRFRVLIANETAEERADIIAWTGGDGIPVYKDYILFVSSSKKSLVNFSIALQVPDDVAGVPITKYNEAILNGVEIFKLSDPDGNLAGPNPDPPEVDKQNVMQPESRGKPKKKLFPMLAIVAGVVSVFHIIFLVGFLLCMHGRKSPKGYVNSTSKASKWGPFSFSATTKSSKSRGGRSSLPSDLCRHFSLAEIISATENFNPSFIIGVGGFGNVYKGHIDDRGASIPVAIKRLKPESSQGAVEFKTEIDMLSQLRHLHLVSLVGYCTDNREMILVYEYMPNGTLRDHLYNTRNAPIASWEQRLHICIGAARGLHYLHAGAKCMIIHRDVKTTNILLDEKWVPKVSDFGLSKMGNTSTSKTHISTMVKGSFGYLDPEYYRRQQLTEKSDVYSFGVVLCEVLCARPALIRTVDKKQMSLAEWTKANNRNGTISQIIDPILWGKISATCLNKFVELALSCMNDNGNERPSMNDVVWGLEFALQLQKSAEVFLDEKGEDEVAFMKGGDEGVSCSWEYTTSDQKNSRTTKTSSSEDLSTNESIRGMSGTIFSEIKDPTVR